MKLISTFYSDGSDLAAGWWATIECSDGRRTSRRLWADEAGPDFDDLAAVVADLAPTYGLDVVLQRAREDARLVRRTKAVSQNATDRGWIS